MTTFTVTIQRGPTVPPVPLYQVLHRYEMGTLKADEPEVTRLEPLLYTPMTEAIQWMCFDLLFWDLRHGDRTSLTADEKRIFNSVFEGDTFITNFRGVEAYRNYITGERMGMDLPGYMSLVLGGNVLTGTEFVAPNGERRLQVDILTGAAPVASLQPWQRQHATIGTLHQLDDGSYQVNPFTQRGGRLGAPVIVPILCNYPVYIPMSKVRKLPPGSPIPSAYNPPW